MDTQEQIDRLKRVVAKQGAEIAHLQRIVGMSAMVMNETPPNPFCGHCGMQMYDGAQCSELSSNCPMGVGLKA